MKALKSSARALAGNVHERNESTEKQRTGAGRECARAQKHNFDRMLCCDRHVMNTTTWAAATPFPPHSPPQVPPLLQAHPRILVQPELLWKHRASLAAQLGLPAREVDAMARRLPEILALQPEKLASTMRLLADALLPYDSRPQSRGRSSHFGGNCAGKCGSSGMGSRNSSTPDANDSGATSTSTSSTQSSLHGISSSISSSSLYGSSSSNNNNNSSSSNSGSRSSSDGNGSGSSSNSSSSRNKGSSSDSRCEGNSSNGGRSSSSSSSSSSSCSSGHGHEASHDHEDDALPSFFLAPQQLCAAAVEWPQLLLLEPSVVAEWAAEVARQLSLRAADAAEVARQLSLHAAGAAQAAQQLPIRPADAAPPQAHTTAVAPAVAPAVARGGGPHRFHAEPLDCCDVTLPQAAVGARRPTGEPPALCDVTLFQACVGAVALRKPSLLEVPAGVVVQRMAHLAAASGMPLVVADTLLAGLRDCTGGGIKSGSKFGTATRGAGSSSSSRGASNTSSSTNTSISSGGGGTSDVPGFPVCVLSAALEGPNLLAVSSCFVDRRAAELGRIAGGARPRDVCAMLLARPALLSAAAGGVANKWRTLEAIAALAAKRGVGSEPAPSKGQTRPGQNANPTDAAQAAAQAGAQAAVQAGAERVAGRTSDESASSGSAPAAASTSNWAHAQSATQGSACAVDVDACVGGGATGPQGVADGATGPSNVAGGVTGSLGVAAGAARLSDVAGVAAAVGGGAATPAGLSPGLTAALLAGSFGSLAKLKFLVEQVGSSRGGRGCSGGADGFRRTADGSGGKDAGGRGGTADGHGSCGCADEHGRTSDISGGGREQGGHDAERGTAFATLASLAREVVCSSDATFHASHPGFAQWLAR
eukprot:366554-Chlamydomonas_euryale.AAC.3